MAPRGVVRESEKKARTGNEIRRKSLLRLKQQGER
jgi:hypothetical protein